MLPPISTSLTQRDPYTDTAKKRRYIFTFIDANQNRIADSVLVMHMSSEQRAFVAGSVSDADLIDTSTIFPYIPLTANSKLLPTYLDIGSVAENTQDSVFITLTYGRINTFFSTL